MDARCYASGLKILKRVKIIMNSDIDFKINVQMTDLHSWCNFLFIEIGKGIVNTRRGRQGEGALGQGGRSWGERCVGAWKEETWEGHI